MADSKRWLNQRVSVQSLLMVGPEMCTQVECPPENPCCNQCGAGVIMAGVRDITLQNMADMNQFSCRSQGCSMCCGVELPRHEVIVTGTLKMRRGFMILEEAQVCDPTK